jgi:formylglycine-generating enzyme
MAISEAAIPGVAQSNGMRCVASGTFLMGDDNAYPEEAPAHHVSVSGFWIDEYAVTNAEFAAFVATTGWVGRVKTKFTP